MPQHLCKKSDNQDDPHEFESDFELKVAQSNFVSNDGLTCYYPTLVSSPAKKDENEMLPLLDLPELVLENILSYVTFDQVAQLRLVSTR